ncbi:HESB-like domain-containing protein 1 [Cladobotryum mycophilum]|uniref:HESB-like domain-containing protein 1 n=1 Tax=Cladobotryum mycophilum TaxID=491253 RepID=A0ABR0T0E4_9HYPO
MTPIRCAHGTSAARSFIQLAKRRYTTTSTPLTTPLDFLVPGGASSSSKLRITNASPRFLFSANKLQLSRYSGSSFSIHSTRSFTTSPTRLATVCIQNPQKDDDGNDAMLEITSGAAKRLSEIMAKDKNPNLALRIQVESGGCHGFQYLMSLITLPPKDAQESSSIVNEDDSIFQYIPDGVDPTSVSQGPRIILDEPSLDLLKGSKVDFTRELIGSQFKIIDNPFATSSCGCGTSFDIKM